MGFRSGFIAIIGRPNVGKSTLLNFLVREKVAIISDKPQTTRNRILAVKNLPEAQIVFLDTPGIHKPQYRLNERMVRVALDSIREVDLIFFLVEATSSPGGGDRYIIDLLKKGTTPVFLVINKVDLVRRETLLPLIDEYSTILPFSEILPISALTGENVDRLIQVAVPSLPEGAPYFPEDLVTDQPLRFLAGEIIREKILKRTWEEIPYAVAVAIEEFDEESATTLVRIGATVFVEKDSQKGILIGKGGEMMKAVATEAREELEGIIGTKVFLRVWVKVKENWRQDEAALRLLGY